MDDQSAAAKAKRAAAAAMHEQVSADTHLGYGNVGAYQGGWQPHCWPRPPFLPPMMMPQQVMSQKHHMDDRMEWGGGVHDFQPRGGQFNMRYGEPPGPPPVMYQGYPPFRPPGPLPGAGPPGGGAPGGGPPPPGGGPPGGGPPPPGGGPPGGGPPGGASPGGGPPGGGPQLGSSNRMDHPRQCQGGGGDYHAVPPPPVGGDRRPPEAHDSIKSPQAMAQHMFNQMANNMMADKPMGALQETSSSRPRPPQTTVHRRSEDSCSFAKGANAMPLGPRKNFSDNEGPPSPAPPPQQMSVDVAGIEDERNSINSGYSRRDRSPRGWRGGGGGDRGGSDRRRRDDDRRSDRRSKREESSDEDFRKEARRAARKTRQEADRSVDKDKSRDKEKNRDKEKDRDKETDRDKERKTKKKRSRSRRSSSNKYSGSYTTDDPSNRAIPNRQLDSEVDVFKV
eukprot:GHVL01044367.1.p1 GENE.GHVL01044367.1~~GHVL01044367.1.p1  ORF type:complete len:450 (+),score=125.16 GHVL01044367.1:95-1444(+)